jgi:diaminohydroxyphosphoribosylaminopyrimidine deaminase/5-amino-6-(5-phosphoribosylamino)uracil reductase
MTSIELLMQRAHDLARNGMGSVSPNPMVGCIIAKGDRIIGEGWHKVYGGPHAETNAVASIGNKQLLEGSTVIVNLEPCSHYGKTPPCADLLINHRVGRVVISNMDSNPLVAGRGIARLRSAGIEVITGVLESEGRQLNCRFFTMVEKKRPYVILKWAQTANGFMAGGSSDPRWITNATSRQLVHRWRAEEDAVLVGYRTALNDNPRLNVRDWTGRDPLRIVLDNALTLPRSLHVFDGTQRTIIFNNLRNDEQEGASFIKVDPSNFVNNILSNLYNNQVQSVIVEGGEATLKSFIKSGQWDEARVFESPLSFQDGLRAPSPDGVLQSTNTLAGDTLKVYQNFIPIAAPLK